MIARGTTPTIKYTFTIINPSDITVAYLTIKQGSVTIERDIDTATVNEDSIEWTLTQEETLALSTKTDALIQCRYKTGDGKAYITKTTKERPYDSLKEGVI